MNSSIENAILNLSWDSEKHLQEKAIAYLAQNIGTKISWLIMPREKQYWENAAKVIKILGSPQIDPHILELTEWLKDMNWPGATIIMEFLIRVDDDILLPNLDTSLRIALDDQDEIWANSIKYLREKRSSNRK